MTLTYKHPVAGRKTLRGVKAVEEIEPVTIDGVPLVSLNVHMSNGSRKLIHGVVAGSADVV